MVILFLVSNYNPIYLAGNETNKEKESRIKMFFVPMMCLIVLMLFCSLFFVAENIAQISEDVRERKMVKQEEVVKNPMILPSHAVHIAVKKFYLGKKFEEEWSDKTYAELEMNERKRARLKDKLSDNFLLKRSSDVILIIVAVSTSLLLLGTKKTEKKS
jgi:hypothetical protein